MGVGERAKPVQLINISVLPRELKSGATAASANQINKKLATRSMHLNGFNETLAAARRHCATY